MKKLAIIFGGFLLGHFMLATVVQADANTGKQLLHGGNCLQCHGTQSFIKKQQNLAGLPQLDQQVRRCDSKLASNLFDDEIQDVVSYLNSSFYGF